MDTDEMYRRGAADAEQGEPHPFFYQHYYHYRRGYDQARRRRFGLFGDGRRLALRLALVLIVVAGAAYGASLLGRRQPEPQADALSAAPSPRPTATAAPSRTPIFPTATSLPTVAPLALRIGGAALVSGTEGRPLLARAAPGTASRRVASFSEGERVTLLEGPVEADGYVWWRVEGSSGTGWSAQGSPEGATWLAPIADS